MEQEDSHLCIIRWVYEDQIQISRVSDGSSGNREVYLLFIRLLPLDTRASSIVGELIHGDRVWHEQQPRISQQGLGFVPLQPVVSLQNCREARSTLRWSVFVFPGHGPDRHSVESGHRSWRQAGGVRHQPPPEREWAAEAARAWGGEEAALDAGAGEGPAGAAAAGWGNGRVHTPPSTKRPSAADHHTPGGYSGTRNTIITHARSVTLPPHLIGCSSAVAW